MHRYLPSSWIAFSSRLSRPRLFLEISITWWVDGLLALMLAAHMQPDTLKRVTMQLHRRVSGVSQMV